MRVERPLRPDLRIASVCIAVATLSTALSNAQDKTGGSDLGPLLTPFLERSKSPALAAAIYRDGMLVAAGVSGVRSTESNEPATIDDRFPIGSCSKPMARLVLARLAERGVIDFDTPLSKLLQGTPMREEYANVTLADLMAHRGGIQPYTEIGPQITPIIFELKGTPREQRAAFTAHVLGEAPAAPPRTRFVYSNAGFCILAVAAERAAGQDWEKLVADEVLTPLSLRSATVGGGGVALRGHRQTPDGIRAARPFPRLAVMAPAGGVSLSIGDFAAFASAEADLEAGRPAVGLTDKTLKRLPALRPGDAGPAGRGGTITFGGDGQYHAAFAVWPKQRVAVAVACNLGESDDLCTQVAEAVRAAFAADLEPVAGGASTGGGGDGPRYGFGLKVEGDRLEVATVSAGSIAEKAGLKDGDLIVKINGEPISSIEEQKRMELIRSSALKLVVERGGRELEIAMRK